MGYELNKNFMSNMDKIKELILGKEHDPDTRI